MPKSSVFFRRCLWCAMLLAMVLRLIFFLYTHRTWEDALITVLHSEDFVRGLGLSHPVPPGEGPLHGFTSPLSVLIPLVGDLMHVGFGVTFLKLVSIPAGAASVWLGAQIALEVGLSEILALVVAFYLAVEHHQILWGMAGMETQVVTLIYLFVLYSCFRGSPWQKGLSLGLAMLARPDAAFLVLLAFAYELWHSKKHKTPWPFGPMLGGLTLLYAPWLIFTTLYYGSPVPNTILAKGLGYPSVLSVVRGLAPTAKLSFLFHRFITTLATLGPVYGGNGTGFPVWWDHRVICSLMILLLLAGFYSALKQRQDKALLVYAFVLIYSAYLTLTANRIFGWYTIPVAAAGVIGAMYGLQTALSAIPSVSTRNRVTGLAGVAYLLVFAVALPFTMHSDKYIQRNIETGVRMKMGLYLQQVSYPNDTIGSESLGYVGYYSHRVVYDYPGLCSRAVIQYLRDYPGARSMPAMLETLQPSYIVIRPVELGWFPMPWLDKDYDLVQVFAAEPGTESRIIGPQYNIDTTFRVYRKKGIPFRPLTPQS